MPHAELSYSADLGVDAAAILREIESVILRHDAGAEECKGRAYPADIFHHSHILVTLSLLTKPHRDKAFTQALLKDIEQAVKAMIARPCFFSVKLNYTDDTYLTNRHAGAG